jgi:hypothetical protein
MGTTPRTLDRSLLVSITIALLSLLVSSLTAYHNDQTAIVERVRGLEVQSTNDTERMNRIERKIDDMYVIIVGRNPQ